MGAFRIFKASCQAIYYFKFNYIYLRTLNIFILNYTHFLNFYLFQLEHFINISLIIISYLFLDSPYHDVSGLPNPYNMEHMDQDEVISPQQHMSLSYDDSFEGEYSSTPNSRNRRVIREIIV